MKYCVLFVIALTLQGCSNKIKQKIGLTTTGPNEYHTERQRPLEVPPHYDLPAPNSLESTE
ncbi:MAG UNVERIFIED_CONTAM: DUF3035 domain-containing protein [Rickettsiaceae bacterium]|jgi:hypothetical protein